MSEKKSIKNKWISILTALLSFGLLFSICIAVSSATIEVPDIEEGDGIWCTLDVETVGLVSAHTWTNGSGHDEIGLYLYNQTGDLVASDYDYDDDAFIDYVAPTAGTYTVKAYLGDAFGGGTRTVSVSSNRPLSLMPKYKESVPDVEKGQAIWYDLSVDREELVFVNAWTNGSGHDEIGLYLYNQTGDLVASDYDYDDDASIDYVAPTAGTYTVKAYLGDAFGGGTRTVSVSSNCPLEGAPTSVSIITNKTRYSSGDKMTVTINIANPTEESVKFQWYWVVPQFSICVPVMSVPIPADYDDTHDFSFTIPNWGSTPFGNVFYAQLLDASGEVLDADCAYWIYSSSGKVMPTKEIDIAKEIKKTIERAELPS
jgi:hypothetical protein